MPNLLLQSPLKARDFWQTHKAKIFWKSSQTSYTYQDLFEKAQQAQKRAPSEIWSHPSCPEIQFAPLSATTEINFFAQLLALIEQGLSPLLVEAQANRSTLHSQLADRGFKLKNQIAAQSSGSSYLVFKTSGSTGKPKFIFHQMKTLWHSHTNLQETLKPLKILPFKRAGLCLPLHHIGGLMLVMRQFFQGETIVALDSYQDLLTQDDQLDCLSLVPAQLYELVESPILKKISFILLGGAPLSKALWKKSFEHKLSVFPSFGATETGSLVTLATPANQLENTPTTAPPLGKPLKGVLLERDSENNLMIKSESLAQGILLSDGSFQKTNEWLTLPDQVKQNQNSEWQTLGRKDSVFICGGENLSPEALESLYLQHPDIQKALISPRPHAKLGQVPHLSFKTSSSKNPFQIFREASVLLSKDYPRKYWPRSFDNTLVESPLKILRAPTNKLIKEKFQALKTTPRCFFLHGFLGDPSDYDALLKELLERGVSSTHLFALSLNPPLSQRTQDQDQSDTDFKEQILSNLEKQIQSLSEAEPFILAGYSLGARIVFELMARKNLNPQPLKILAMAGHPGLKSEQEKQERLLIDQKRARELKSDSKKFLHEWYQLPLFGNLRKHPSFEQRFKEQLEQDHEHNGRLLTSFSLGHQNDYSEKLKTWGTTYIYGEEDQAYKQLAENLPIKSHPISGAAHSLHLENPQALAQILKTYLLPEQ